MKILKEIKLANVQDVYSGPEGDLWELIMGQQIHIGGFASSMDLLQKSGVGSGMVGVDMCCCNGAGMRFLLRFGNVSRMIGVDATEKVLERAKARAIEENLADKMEFIKADVCDSGIADNSKDFVWGEDAWCYVEDKAKLIAEAARIIKPGGKIAFTDWLEGPGTMNDEQAHRFMSFMKFPTLQTIEGYKKLLESNGLKVHYACDTNRYEDCINLYIDMLNKQLTYDALKIIGFDTELMGAMANEMVFIQQLAREKRIIQGLFVAEKIA